MKKTAVIYGSTTGNTEAAAKKIAEELGVSDIRNVDQVFADELLSYDNIIVGSSTWGCGELQDGWEALAGKIRNLDLSGKKVAFFGTGDQNSYTDTFVDALGLLYDEFTAAKAEVIGTWPTDGYVFSASKAVRDNMLVGLALDEDNQAGKSEERIKKWVEKIHPQLQ